MGCGLPDSGEVGDEVPRVDSVDSSEGYAESYEEVYGDEDVGSGGWVFDFFLLF